MTQEYITKMITECHQFFVDRGDYLCKACIGNCVVHKYCIECDYRKDDYSCKCNACNGTGKHRDTSEILLQIIGCLWQAAVAYRQNEKSYPLLYQQWFCMNKKYDNAGYNECLKNTFEDHLATAFIHLFDLAGYLGIEYKTEKDFILEKLDTISKKIYHIINTIPGYQIIYDLNSDSKDMFIVCINETFNACLEFCKLQNIDIQKHIQAKLEYMRNKK